MSKSYRFSLVLLSSIVVFALADSRSAFGQRRSGSNQGSSEKKKDKEEDDKKEKKDRREQNNQGTQGSQGQGGSQGKDQSNSSNKNQGGNQNNQANNQGGSNQGNSQGSNQNNNQNADQNNDSNKPRNFSRSAGKAGGSNDSKNSGNSNVPSQLQPFVQGGRNQNDKDKDKDKKDRDDQDPNFQGQGGRIFNPGRDGNSGNKLNPGVIIGPDGAGNAQPTNRKFGSWRGDRWEGSRKADHWTEHFGGKQRLFSSQWYKDHPNAWKHNHDKTNVWVVATVPGIYSWLGWGAVPQQYAIGYGPTERFDASHYGEWYPLGVYSLMSGGEDMGTRVVQLAVDHHGHIGGNYFDMITNDDKSISGNIDRQTQRVEFWLNRNPNVRFYTSVYRLLQNPYGSITVHLPGGDQRWQFVRLEN